MAISDLSAVEQSFAMHSSTGQLTVSGFPSTCRGWAVCFEVGFGEAGSIENALRPGISPVVARLGFSQRELPGCGMGFKTRRKTVPCNGPPAR